MRCVVVIILFSLNLSHAQSLNSSSRSLESREGNIYGYIYNAASQQPVTGASIQVIKDSRFSITNEQGLFRLEHVPVGRHSLRISHLSYKAKVIEHVLVTSGKESFVEIYLEDSIKSLQEIVIDADRDKREPVNPGILAGGRKFSVEETQKYAVAVNDPARMISSFPGVTAINDGENNLSVRGNSPIGLLWRLEGVEVPNPNHFANIASSGGGISILSAQVLGNSDFLNAAFPAEYGNALSGVFDMHLRKGNNQKREYTVQVGLIGLDISTEGPFRKGDNGSYLVNYRYSTLGILGALGVELDNGVSKFQDMSFTVRLPEKKAGAFQVFGVGGVSSQTTDSRLIDFLGNGNQIRLISQNISNMGLIGVKHNIKINPKLSSSSTISYTGYLIQTKEEKGEYLLPLTPIVDNQYHQGNFSITSSLNFRINNKNLFKTGVTFSQPVYRLREGNSDAQQQLLYSLDQNGTTHVFRGYVQLYKSIPSRVALNAGVHYSYFSLGASKSIEPRISIKHYTTQNYSISVGYGLHSQIQPLGIYFYKDPSIGNSLSESNTNLGFAKTHHLLISQDLSLNDHHHIRMDGYYQYLYNIPVSTDKNDKTSALNVVDGFLNQKLENSGLGRNYGVELSIERFYYRHFYYLLSSSLFNSRYRASDKIWYNTLFNTHFGLNATLGNELNFSKRKNPLTIGVNLRAMYNGGLRTTPIDFERSINNGTEVLSVSETHAAQLPAYSRIDFRISFKTNFKRYTQTLSVDIQNVFDRENVARQSFNPMNNRIRYSYQNGIIPIVSYKAEF